MKPFYTPPINSELFDGKQALKESYNYEETSRSPTSSTYTNTDLVNEILKKDTTLNSNLSGSSEKEILTSTEIERIRSEIQELPIELTKYIDLFITDLKQPKYVSPLSILQLVSIFQSFYTEFDKSVYVYLTTLSVNSTNTFINAREALSSGLSSIFARSRSNSATSNINRNKNKRSSSLFSASSFTNMNNATPLLSPEEIDQQIKQNAIINVKCTRYLELCERGVFNKLIEVGTSATPIEIMNGTSNNNQLKNNKEQFSVKTLFKNTPEYIKFDKWLGEKVHCLNRLYLSSNFELTKFLGISDTVSMDSSDLHDIINNNFTDLIIKCISPYEKISKLLDIHNILSQKGNATSNDDFLSVLIYYIIKLNPKNIFLNEEFIKLFRYKKKLVESEMFALTNLNAALMYLEGLILNDLPNHLKNNLTEDECSLFKNKISDIITLPSTKNTIEVIEGQNIPTINNKDLVNSNTPNFGWSNYRGEPKLIENEDSVIRSNSYEGIKSVLDGSLKHIISKVKAYNPVYQETVVGQLNPVKNSPQLFAEVDKKTESLLHLGPSPSHNKLKDTKVNTQETLCLKCKTDGITLVEEHCKYKDVPFENMNIGQLREMYEIYQKLVE